MDDLNTSSTILYHHLLFKFEGNRLKITIRKGKQIWIDLSVRESLSMRRLRIGEIIITPEKVIIPFKKDIKLIQPKQ